MDEFEQKRKVLNGAAIITTSSKNCEDLNVQKAFHLAISTAL